MLLFEALGADFSALMARYGFQKTVDMERKDESDMPRFGFQDLSDAARALVDEAYHKDFVQSSLELSGALRSSAPL